MTTGYIFKKVYAIKRAVALSRIALSKVSYIIRPRYYDTRYLFPRIGSANMSKRLGSDPWAAYQLLKKTVIIFIA